MGWHIGRTEALSDPLAARRKAMAKLRGLAELHKRRGEVDRARELWEELSREEGLESVIALHELAMHREHRERDFRAAIDLCDEALTRLEGGPPLAPGVRERWREAFEHRRKRLSRRREARQ